jgi:hypothetical protein
MDNQIVIDVLLQLYLVFFNAAVTGSLPDYFTFCVGNSYELTMGNNRFIIIILSMLLNYRVLSQKVK